MAPLEPFRATRPRRWCQSAAPKTPEPTCEDQAQQQQHQQQQQQPPISPSSPTRLRFRLRRRTTPQLSAPTTQFLASVAAADVPLPSIEEPSVYDDKDMLSIVCPSIPPLDRFEPIHFGDHSGQIRSSSPPKTPAAGLGPSLLLKQYPDWSVDGALSSLESSPEYESSRPSTARSTQTSSSLFSQYSFASEDSNQCASPDGSEHNERFAHFLAPEDADRTVKSATQRARSAKYRRAPWTRTMSRHLWSTYMTYLQDPKVTPFRIGRSGIPPSGVCVRVAREAKRSWKGSRLQTESGIKSGSSTPTAESAGPCMEWPHTCSATRSRLRELCKAQSAATARHIQYLSNSPTPFGKAANRSCVGRSVPAPSSSVFSGSDMAMSLTVCTADSMQIQGPLAKLASSPPAPRSPSLRQPLSAEQLGARPLGGDLQQTWPPRLGSPFTARSYGPSSSSGLTGSLNEDSGVQRRKSHTVGPRRGLRSPAKVDQQSRSSTQKRRSRQSVLEPRRTKRPSLGSDFWIDPSVDETTDCHDQQLAEYSSTDSKQRDNLFVPRTNLQELFEASNPTRSDGLTGSASFPAASALTSCQTVPARLGSPFSATRTRSSTTTTISHSFPKRNSSIGSSALNSGPAPGPFATTDNQSREKPGRDVVKAPAAPSTSDSIRTPLIDRLAYIDERLKDFRRRDRNNRRSEPPT